MKKIFLIIITTLMITLSVNAENYDLNELIPINKETTLGTDNLRYINFSYKEQENKIVFENIKNVSNEDKAITITIALFSEDKKNIGTVNYCTNNMPTNNQVRVLKPNESTPYQIAITKDYLGDEYNLKDIKYIAVISDNKNCLTKNKDIYLGQKIDEIGQAKNNTLSKSAELLIKMLTIIGGVLLVIFVYNFMFSSKYRNMDGEDVRQEYSYINKELENKRKYDAIHNPKPKKIKKETKTKEVKYQEEAENNNANKESSDLHNFYK